MKSQSTKHKVNGGERKAEMALFFLEQAPRPDGITVIAGDEAKHLSRVLRYKPGDIVFATDGQGTEYELELVSVTPVRTTGRVRATRVRPREPRIRLVLAQSVIKGDRMAELVQSVTQLGVAEIVPFTSARTVAGLKQARLEHLRRTMREAVKCSMRTVLPLLSEPVSLSELLGRTKEFDAAVAAYEGEEDAGLADVLGPQAESVLLVVGPEGGFAPEEVAAMQAAGIRSFSMGPRRFRAETAASAAVTLVLSHLGELTVRVPGSEGPKVRNLEPMNPRTLVIERRC